jgi:carbon-monoxide dehydrogenase large subunit
MVLSLTTSSDGREAQYGALVADMLDVPPLDVKVVPNDTDRFGIGHGFNTYPSGGTSEAIQKAVGKIIGKGGQLAAVALGVSPGSVAWSDGAWHAGGQSKTLEDVALYAHGSGPLPPGVEGGLDAQAVYQN